MSIKCPHCKKLISVPPHLLGRQAICPACQGKFQLPSFQTSPISSSPTAIPPDLPATNQAPTESTKVCPYCGEQVLYTAKKCKHCGEFLGKQPHPFQGEVRTNIKQGALIGGWVCAVLGIVMMFVSLGLFFIYAPLFLVAFILSITAMAQRRIVGGILLLLFTIIVLPILLIGLGANRFLEIEQAKKLAITQCKIEGTQGEY